jgi:LPXTG-site transpeptidase (sortase) family protein
MVPALSRLRRSAWYNAAGLTVQGIFMRIRTFCSLLLLIATLLVGCGSPAQEPQSIAEANVASPAATATQQPSATSVPPTATVLPPTAVPTAEPTALPPTAEPTALPPTAEPTAVPPTAAPAIAADTNDIPQLDESAGTQVVDQPVAVTPAQPVRLQIPAIKLDYKPVSVGLDKNRVPIVPKHDVGWYNLSAMPGQGDNIVFWGHVLRFKSAPKIPAPFARVKELQPGASIIVTTARGEKAYYKVRTSVQVTPDQVSYILPVGKEQLTLVSCIGDNVISGGGVTKKYRLITIADPVK